VPGLPPPTLVALTVVFCGLTLFSSVIAGTAGYRVPGAAVLTAMGQSADPPDAGRPPSRDVPGYDDRRPAGPPSDLSRSAIARKVELKKSLAQAIRNDAYALQQQRRYREAVVFYRESLAYWPDPGLETYIRALEGRAGLATPGLPSTTYPANSGRTGSVVTTFRNRSPADVSVTTGASASTPETLVRAGDIVTFSVPLSQGQVPFSVLWNGKLIASATWYEDPRAPGVPCLLFDDTLPGRLVIMTGFRREGP
jgi:hypothetical protein